MDNPTLLAGFSRFGIPSPPRQVPTRPPSGNCFLAMTAGEVLCIVTLESCAIGREWVNGIKKRVTARFQIPGDKVVVHAHRNQIQPNLSRFPAGQGIGAPGLHAVSDGLTSYAEDLTGRVLEGVERAFQDVEPVEVLLGRSTVDGIAFNARLEMRDGTIRSEPGPGNVTQVLCAEGPFDPDVTCAFFINRRGEAKGVMLHFTCGEDRESSLGWDDAGWPARWAQTAHALFGKACGSLVLMGCAGNVRAKNPLDPTHPRDRTYMDTRLAEAARLAAERSVAVDRPGLKVMSAKLQLPSQNSLCESEDYLLVGARIGSLALVTFGGEPFVEGQWELRMGSPASVTLGVQGCHGVTGPIPTRHAHQSGGPGTGFHEGAHFRREALEEITGEGLRLLRRLFEAGPGSYP